MGELQVLHQEARVVADAEEVGPVLAVQHEGVLPVRRRRRRNPPGYRDLRGCGVAADSYVPGKLQVRGDAELAAAALPAAALELREGRHLRPRQRLVVGVHGTDRDRPGDDPTFAVRPFSRHPQRDRPANRSISSGKSQ